MSLKKELDKIKKEMSGARPTWYLRWDHIANAIISSQNIDSVTDNGTGFFTVKPSKPFNNSKFIVTALSRAQGHYDNVSWQNASSTSIQFAVAAVNNGVVEDNSGTIIVFWDNIDDWSNK